MSSALKRFIVLALAGIIPIAVFLQLPMGTWADFAGLPNHPLVVHLVVVLLPVVAVWTVLAAVKPVVLERTFPYLFAAAVIGALASIVAKSSGDSLSAAVGLPDEHADAGNRLLTLSYVLVGVILVMGGVSKFWPRKPALLGSRALAVIVAVVALPFTYVAGHSGAEATWKDEYAAAQEPISSDSVTLTMEEVGRRNTREQCWTVVDGVVYDVTSFVQRHPAGAGDIIDMCGVDASDDFLGQHDGQAEPEKWLETLKIGVLPGR